MPFYVMCVLGVGTLSLDTCSLNQSHRKTHQHTLVRDGATCCELLGATNRGDKQTGAILDYMQQTVSVYMNHFKETFNSTSGRGYR